MVVDSEHLIFDDDVIFLIAKILNCYEDLAENSERVCKMITTYKILEKSLSRYSKEKNKMKSILNNLRKYGFCKAHALSYAQLVWSLAYQKQTNRNYFGNQH